MKKIKLIFVAPLILGATFVSKKGVCQADTLRVMTYNVLYYGDNPPCQGAHSLSHGYLSTIVAYAKPDILGLEKMAAIPIYAGDHSGTAPAGFADSVVDFALNTAIPGTYTYCPYTNTAGGDNIDVLFYNKNKLGFVSILSTYSNITDFNTYKLYYKDATLATTHDTLFLFVTLNHDNSGNDSSDSTIRAGQIDGEMNLIQTHFSHLPNMINMGDYNTHISTEGCYQRFVSPTDTNYKYYDPAFYPDELYTYPANWDAHPSTYTKCLTTSTRLSSSVPNSCGSSGGGKSWYDHIFLSSDIINNVNRLHYLPHSYTTIGNDGNRVGISVNDAPTNTSAPTGVINALFQMSNKYPIVADLVVAPPTTLVNNLTDESTPSYTVSNPIENEIVLHCSQVSNDKNITLSCFDVLGRQVMQYSFVNNASVVKIPCQLKQGNYILKIMEDGKWLDNIKIYKK